MSEYVQLDLFEDLPASSGEARPRRKRRKRLAEETLDEKIERALRLLRSAASGSDQPIEVSYSGGKDSDVILELVRMAGIPYRAIYKNTTIDPPGTIKHCLDKGVEVVRRATFADVIREHGFPTWRRRFCCDVLKEYKILDRSVQGIRRSESTKRARRYKEPTVCRLYGQDEHVEVFLPILHWTDKDVASFIQRRGIQCHPLYYDGGGGEFHPERRLGCMGCPQRYDRGIQEFKEHPGLVRFWLRNGKMWWDTHDIKGVRRKYSSPYEVFVCNVFFHSYKEFREATDGLFGKVDCKKFLEDYFKIKL